MFGVPINEDQGQQVQRCPAAVLSFRGSIPDVALSPDAEDIFQRVMPFTLVQPDLSTALHVGVQQVVDNEQGALNQAKGRNPKSLHPKSFKPWWKDAQNDGWPAIWVSVRTPCATL